MSPIEGVQNSGSPRSGTGTAVAARDATACGGRRFSTKTLRASRLGFWEHQDKVFENMQTFTNIWFEHRHTGTHAAQEAAERMCKTETTLDLVQAYQDWAKGALERMMADGLACQQHIIAATGALASPPIAPSVTEKRTEQPTQPEVKAPAQSKAT